jgi:hypothetical protein
LTARTATASGWSRSSRRSPASTAPVAAQPLLAELLLIHSATTRRADARASAERASERFVALLARGRPAAEAARGRPLPPISEEYFSRMVVRGAANRVIDRPQGLPDAAPDMTLLIGAFYLGPEEAVRALASRTSPSTTA